MQIRAENFKKLGKNIHIMLYLTTICFLNSTIKIPKMLIAKTNRNQ